jgi:endoglucanase Acf2
MIMLPTESQPFLERIATLPWVIPTHTQASFDIDGDVVRTTYQIVTPDDAPVLFTTWPHHQLTTENPSVLGEFQTVLGTQKVLEGTHFTTSQPVPPMPEQFTKVTSATSSEAIKSAIRTDTQGFISGKNAMPAGVYFKGTWIGSLTSLVQLADLYELPAERDQLLALLERVEFESLTQFRYDEESSMMVATNPEFGNEFGNDHHFHYAYYIRAAAVLLTYKPELQSQLQPRIEELIADVATWEDTSNRFPRLRMFSVFEGHAWADGRAQFADGNNEESSSESLNTWYAIALWGQKTEQTELTNRARWLFSQDLAAIKAYWFAQENPFPMGYLRPTASLIWGGKREFATWFSADPMHVYGIQWLPITPASSYLRTITTLPTVIAELQKSVASPAAHEWGDLYTAVLAQVDPQQALQQLPLVQSSNGLKLQSLLFQAVYQETQ